MKKKTGLTELLHYKELLRQLVIKDIKLKYRRSYLGYVWSILNPLLMMTVLVIVFSQLFRFDIPNFAVYLLSGQVLFSFLSEATTMAVSSIVSNAQLLKKTYVPKYIFTVSKVTSSLVNLLFSLIALVLVMIFTQVSVTWHILWVPVILLEVYIFSLGISFILAATAVFFRDIQYLWGVFISIWMYLTPIIYPVSIISEEYRWWYDNLNPMYGYVTQFRDVVLNGNPLLLEWLTQGFIVAFAFLFIGYWVFKRKQNQFILYI
ncbi:ABC transporter [Rodentibacter rarus]|uniref:Transport permease protein n=1 Tax=Rodentibacter rarus TaxID=1908260 RepID=A0A1V3IMN8_9PAST|nr:ABC transporter permease [Rodentibacter rarus]OOF42646.1 ABC transporter [Rodentibacter rarus]OOF42952.1 ABC transporter [Rodentibacter rarus]